MGSPKQKELYSLQKYAQGCKFIIESGSGLSTKYLSEAKDPDGIMYSIDVYEQKVKYPGVVYKQGWSMVYEDLILPGHSLFKKSRYDSGPDVKIVFEGKKYMDGEVDWIRRILNENTDKKLDFFFCDTGEYCGIAEWNIVKDIIPIGGYFAAHDIFYPKSVKNFRVFKKIKKSSQWKILVVNKSKQGLMVAEKIK